MNLPQEAASIYAMGGTEHSSRPTRPRAMRSRIAIAGRMSGEFTPPQNVSIDNVSHFGLGGRFADGPPDIGEYISIALESGDVVHGQVRWVDEDRFGIRLSSPFNQDRIDALLPAPAEN